MGKKSLIYLLSIISLCSILIIHGCIKDDPETETKEIQSPPNIKEAENTQPETESPPNESEIEITEELVTTLSDEDILNEVKSMLEMEEKPSLLFKFLDKKISDLDMENVNLVLDSLQQLLKIYETKYMDMLFENNGIYQEKINNYVQEFLGYFPGELTKDEISDMKDAELKDLLSEIFDSGYKMVTIEGSWYPIINYGNFESFLDYASDDYRAYFLFRKVESDKIFAKDAALIITWDELAQRVINAEEFLIKYPDSSKYQEIGESYFSYLMFYYIGMNNTPAFSYETNKFNDDVITSYNKLVSDIKNKDLFTMELISKYMDVIALNDYVINENVRSYIRDSYTQVENKYGIVNPYTGT